MLARTAEPQDVPEQEVSPAEVARLNREIEQLRARLSALSHAALHINEDLDLENVLQRVIDEARSLTGARFGALLTFGESGEIRDLFTSGITAKEMELIEHMPKGHGLLAYLNETQEPLRLHDISSHPRSVGFPRNHPPMKTFLGAPVRHRGEGLGNIYLTEKESGQEFTPEDQDTLMTFAAQAGTAIGNARRYAEEQRARADLEGLVDTSPVGVVIFDANTQSLLFQNQETRRIVRGTRVSANNLEEVHSVLSFRRPDGRQLLSEELPVERVMRDGQTVRAEEIVFHLPDGQTVPTIVNATPIFSEAGDIVSVVATIQDMTPLEELERQRNEFLGMVSHELRMPLSTIKGSAASVLSASPPADPAEMLQFFRIVDEQSDRMRSLISDLLDMARIDSGSFSISPQPTDTVALVEQARSEFLKGGARNSVEIHIPPDLPRINADSQRMLQVLNTLLANGSRISSEQSTIRIFASVEEVHVAISVVDEGSGISREDLPHMFRKSFRQSDGPDTLQGRSLGLAICRGIVEAHGGRIRVESDGPGLGTRFTFTVPMAHVAVSVPSPDPSFPAAGAATATKEQVRVLAVDDQPQILRYIRKVLQEAGYTPIITGDPGEVDALIEAEKPHLVLLGLALSGSDGFRLMREVLDATTAPVIVLSASNVEQDIAQAFESGADDYIAEPFSPSELVSRIAAALRRRTLPGYSQKRLPYRAGDLTINYAERRVTVAGLPVELTATEYNLLYELSTHAGLVLTHDQLLERVWGPGYDSDSQPVRTYVKNLRRKMGDNANRPKYIFTEPRVGYRMARPASPKP